MKDDIESMQKLINAFTYLPGVGRKTAERYAYSIINLSKEDVDFFADSLREVKHKIKFCSVCGNFTDEDMCEICKSRKSDTICVVKEPKDVIAIEKLNEFNGVYHVLGGIISPIDGIGPSDLNISQLVSRLEALTDEDAQAPVEVILALSGDVEGETTAFYIYRMISKFGVTVSSLARGLGFGDDLEYADELTLGRSIVNRQIFKP